MYIIKAISISHGIEWYLADWRLSICATNFELGQPYLFRSINEARYALGVAVGKRTNVHGWKFIVLKAEDKHDNDKFIYCVQCH